MNQSQISPKRRAAASRAKKALEKKLASVSVCPELLPDREIRRLLHGIAIAAALIESGLPDRAHEILARLLGHQTRVGSGCEKDGAA
jgi:nitrogen-specific signal transduction histidine kinase